jgi:hypothetical protein
MHCESVSHSTPSHRQSPCPPLCAPPPHTPSHSRPQPTPSPSSPSLKPAFSSTQDTASSTTHTSLKKRSMAEAHRYRASVRHRWQGVGFPGLAPAGWRSAGTQVTCFTGTKVQILTLRAAGIVLRSVHRSPKFYTASSCLSAAWRGEALVLPRRIPSLSSDISILIY